ncbi:universal stress protein [Haloglomus litoreum]|uniref:universal stress protein n=1 Tax=Haloglomus litoreum TaxID=3034026 RepID=UPI0023E7ADD4|nr:universal stress protein [Haloglomus sp. DT116]
MATYLIGTDAESASNAICDEIDDEIGPDDRLVVVNVQMTDDVDRLHRGEAALAVFEERFGDRATVEVHQLNRGTPPSQEISDYAEKVDADRVVIALRRHSRTERVIFGSVAHSLLQRVTRPITLIPLDEGGGSEN